MIEKLELDEEKLVEIIMSLIEESSKFTTEINIRLQVMLGELDHIKSFKKDEKLVNYAGDIRELVNNLPLEKLIPILKAYVLKTHLVDPYNEKINSPNEVEVQPKSDRVNATEKEQQLEIDELLKQMQK